MTKKIIQLSPNWAKPGDKIIATCDPERHILLYHLADWEEVKTRLNNLVQTNKKLMPLRHLIIGHADKLIVDKAMCVELPSTLVHMCTANMQTLCWVEK